MMTKTECALFLAFTSMGCGASTEKAESETHFLSCETDAECEEAEQDSICVSGRCVAAEEAREGEADSGDARGSADEDTETGDDSDADAPEPATPAVTPVPATANSSPPRPGPTAVMTGGVTPSIPRPPPIGMMPAPSGSPGPGAPGSGGAGPDGVAGNSAVGGESGAGNGESDAMCELLKDEPETPATVTIAVRNAREVPIVLGGPVGCDPTHIEVTALDESSPGSWSGSHCLLGCHIVVAGAAGCTADCPSAAPVLIAPGETGTIEWPGILARAAALPEECCEDSEYCPSECPLIVTAEPGPYQATIAFTEVTPEAAEACALDPFQCPNAFDGNTTFEAVTQDFELGADAIELSVNP